MIRVLPPRWSLQPFEKDLLLDEITGLTGFRPRWDRSEVVLADGCSDQVPVLVERLALSRAVVDDAGVTHQTRQHRLEVAVGGGTRKVTSHALHGLHPYKGKFYPQLARAVMNACSLQRGAVVFDPFAGCGTTVVEAELLGLRSSGVDVNPLAVEVANTKLRVLRRDVDELENSLRSLEKLPKRGVPLPDPYLQRWFPAANLEYLLRVLKGIGNVRDPDARHLAVVCLSAVLRHASFQDPAQIRVYRRKDHSGIQSLDKIFPKAMDDAIADLRATRHALAGAPTADKCSSVELLDSRNLETGEATTDAVVTSPPYANALPYIDTDRLSLRALAMLGPDGQRGAERRLIGNREISDVERRRLDQESEVAISAGGLPERLVRVLRITSEVASLESSGFRKRRTPALLFAYFRDMARVIDGMRHRLRPGGVAVMVVGDSTVAGLRGSRLTVETGQILAELAEDRGFTLERSVTKPLTSFGASETRHQRNAMSEESILFLRAV